MAHDLEIINGKANMFSVGQMPWHKLGTIVESAPNAEEAIKLAGMDWEVGVRPLFNELGERSTHQQTYRKTDNKTLGVVGPTYKPLQNKEAFDFFNPFIETGAASFETAGVLKEGTRVWVMAKANIPNAEIVKDDEIVPYILLSNSHDGTLALRVGFTCQRVVCQNTLHIAHNHKKSKLIRIKHSKNVINNLECIRETMNVLKSEFETTYENYRHLATRQISEADLKKYVQVVFSLEKSVDDDFSDTESTRVFGNILELFETGRGSQLKGVNGTWWGAYNSITEYLTHYRGKSLENRLNSIWFSDGYRLNKRALEYSLVLSS